MAYFISPITYTARLQWDIPGWALYFASHIMQSTRQFAVIANIEPAPNLDHLVLCKETLGFQSVSCGKYLEALKYMLQAWTNASMRTFVNTVEHAVRA